MATEGRDASVQHAVAGSPMPASPALTPNQIRGFWAAWLGWLLDGTDSFIYALVLVPAMRELLPASGIEPTAGNLGYYGSILFSSFLIGWGFAFLWGRSRIGSAGFAR